MAQQIISGGQTSALVTKEINDNFTELYNRNNEINDDIADLNTGVDNNSSLINTINARPHLIKEGTEQIVDGVTIAGSGTLYPIWHYKIWSNGYFEAETYIHPATNAGVTPRTSGNSQNIFKADGDKGILWGYELPRVPYPEALKQYIDFTLSEWATVNASVGCVSGVSRSNAGMNSTTQSASYALYRTDWSAVEAAGTFNFELYIKICPRSNSSLVSPYDETQNLNNNNGNN